MSTPHPKAKVFEQKLLKKSGNCPSCESNDIHQNGAPDGSGTSMTMPMKCNDCELTWYEHYKLQGASDFEEA